MTTITALMNEALSIRVAKAADRLGYTHEQFAHEAVARLVDTVEREGSLPRRTGRPVGWRKTGKK